MRFAPPFFKGRPGGIFAVVLDDLPDSRRRKTHLDSPLEYFYLSHHERPLEPDSFPGKNDPKRKLNQFRREM